MLKVKERSSTALAVVNANNVILRFVLRKLCLSILLVTVGATAAHADTFIVSNTNDSGSGSLRQAIIDANVNLQHDTINFDPAFFGIPRSIVLTSGHIEILPDASDGTYRTVYINGPGAHLLTLDGNDNSRIFHMRDLVTVFLDGVKMTRGNGTPNNETNVLGSGGAIRSSGILTLSNSIVSGNRAVVNGGIGGGILNFTNITIINCAIENNTAGNTGGLSTGGSAKIVNSTISHNFGGGISSGNGAIDLINSTVAFNVGGGINLFPGGPFSYPNMEITNSIVAKNISPTLFGRNISGNVSSTRSTIIGEGDGYNPGQDLGGNQFNVNPRIDPELKPNGGVIPTHALAADSPAIDRGSNCVLILIGSGGCVDPVVTIDARGVIRPQDGDGNDIGTVDIGAFEVRRIEVTSALTVAPDLRPSSDSGVSNSDNVTSNSDLVFDLTGLSNGMTVELLRDGIAVATGIVAGSSITLSDIVTENGQYLYAARQITGEVVNLHGPGTMVVFDNIAPTVTINQAAEQLDPTRIQPIVFNIVFSEAVAGFDSTDLSLAGSSAGVSSASVSIAGVGPAYTAIVSNIDADGTIVASIPVAAVTDAAGNATSASVSMDNIVTLDSTAPVVTINQAASQVDPTRQTPVNFTVVFSEPVTGFTNGDISLAGSTVNTTGAIKTVTGGGATYNVAISNIFSNGGSVVASITGLAAQDLAGNLSSASTSTDNTVYLDNTRPAVTINQAQGQPDPTNGATVNFTVVFSEAVTGFDSADLTYGGSSIPTSQLIANVLGSGSTYTVAITNLPLTNNGLLRVFIRQGAALDAVENSSTASSSTDNSVTIDNIAPGTTINQSISQPDPSSEQPVRFTVIFNELVTGFSSTGISLAGSTANVSAANIQISGSGSVYAVSVSNILSSGQVRATVVAGAANDAVGNGNAASTSTDNVVTVTVVSSGFDFDGDGRSDISVFRPSSGDWYLQQSSAGFRGQNFGSAEDRIVPADYDGDGKTDVAVYRPSNGFWYITNSSTGTVSYYSFGISEDLPIAADYDGDGKADIGVFRPSTGTWYRQNSSNGEYVAAQFGTFGDKPTTGDFDGDAKADLAVFRPSTGAWYQMYSSNGTFFGEQFGIATDKIIPADYDGDGKTDIAIYRPSDGLWYVKNSATTTYVAYVFGLSTDIPTAADFDGDGKADIAVFRPSDGTWYIVNSSNSSYTIYQFGQNEDRPIQSSYSY